jgi:hypothetical protein
VAEARQTGATLPSPIADQIFRLEAGPRQRRERGDIALRLDHLSRTWKQVMNANAGSALREIVRVHVHTYTCCSLPADELQRQDRSFRLISRETGIPSLFLSDVENTKSYLFSVR